MKRLKTLFMSILTGMCLIVNAQITNIDPSYFSTSPSIFLQGTAAVSVGGVITLSAIDKQRIASLRLREKNISTKLFLKLDFGEDYIKVGGAFGIKLKVEIKSNGSTLAGVPQQEIIVDDNNPEALKVVNLLPEIASLSTDITVNVISITDISGNALNFPAGILKNYIDNNLRLSATLERKYGVDVRTELSGIIAMSNAPTIPNPFLDGGVSVPNVKIMDRLVTFYWQPNIVDAYPNYELQILKLYNTDESFDDEPNKITTIIDWSKALKVETQSFNHKISLTIAEGTGYYIWRVRPIGNYFEGGIANNENYGEWSNSCINNTSVTLEKNTLTSGNNPIPYAFYFTDPDENINWIYNRTFAEGDNENQANTSGVKVSEGMNYADGLLRARQSQAYNNANHTTIVSQTISDYSGRPALTTLPVPIDGGLKGYKVGFVQTSSGLYTAADYDKGTYVDNPSTIKDDASSAFSYYSNTQVTLNANADNTNVPNAEGYAFKRTKFKTDGTGRVDEESGVGKVHSLGSQIDGKGRTTRILFGTPSDDELIRMFGDEAPLSESVIKTITIDPNNVVSVTYTSKEGKTIATALLSENTDNLVSLKKPATSLTVTNTADQNIVSGGKFISSKRIVVPSDNFPIKLSYNVGPFPEPCGGGCSFNVKFHLVDLKKNITYISDSDPSTSAIEGFVVSSGALVFPVVPNSWKFIATDGSLPKIPTAISGGAQTNIVTLDEGEYLFIKEVYSSKSEADIEAAGIAYGNTYQVILDAIAVKMQATQTPAGQTALTTFYQTLEQLITTYQASPTPANSDALVSHLGMTEDVPVGYLFPQDFSLAYTPDATPGATSDNIDISIANGAGAGCESCPSINVAVPKPEICYACDGIKDPIALNDMIAANIAAPSNEELPYGVDDIIHSADFTSLSVADKRNAIDAIVERYFMKLFYVKLLEEQFVQDLNDPTSVQDALNNIAPGFTMEQIKFMISNMIVSKYYTGYAIIDAGTWVKATKDETTGTLVSTEIPVSQDLIFNYPCEDLLNCWTNALNLLASFSADGNVNAVTEFNNQDGNNSAQDNSDDDDNWNEMSKRQKRKLKKKLSQELEDFSNSSDGNVPTAKIEAMTSLVSNFMDCAKYQFAAIIDGDELPNNVSLNKIPDDYSEYTSSRPTEPVISYTLTPSSGSPITYDQIPILGTLLAPHTFDCDGVSTMELYYPYILKPEWMFKYFEYNAYSTTNPVSNSYIDDKDVIIPNQVLVEIKSNYNSIDGYKSISGLSVAHPDAIMCRDATISNMLHNNWSSVERLAFYKEISGAPKCYKNKGVASPYEDPNPPPPPLCTDGDINYNKVELIRAAKAELENYRFACSDKRTEIKTALIASLEAACYRIVDCKSASPAKWEITDKEIDLMVQKVIRNGLDNIDNIESKLPPINVNTADLCDDACASGGTAPYGCDLETEFPKYSEIVCYEILLDKEDNLFYEASKKINVVLFADCDVKILDFLGHGDFIPFINALDAEYCAPNCTPNVAAKEWGNANLQPINNCPDDPLLNGSKEWPSGSTPTTNFSKYSAETTIYPTSGP